MTDLMLAFGIVFAALAVIIVILYHICNRGE